MTLLEKAKEMGLEILHDDLGEYALGCPFWNDLESFAESREQCFSVYCSQCYAREYVEGSGSRSGSRC